MAATPPICEFGWKAVDFKLEGVDGKSYTLADVRGPNGTLVMFICNHCPYVKAILDRLVRDVRELQANGIGVIAIMPNDPDAYTEDSIDNMKAVAEKNGFTFPYVIDGTQTVARAYNAVCTPDFYGFNADLELQYRGRLDKHRFDVLKHGIGRSAVYCIQRSPQELKLVEESLALVHGIAEGRPDGGRHGTRQDSDGVKKQQRLVAQ